MLPSPSIVAPLLGRRHRCHATDCLPPIAHQPWPVNHKRCFLTRDDGGVDVPHDFPSITSTGSRFVPCACETCGTGVEDWNADVGWGCVKLRASPFRSRLLIATEADQLNRGRRSEEIVGRGNTKEVVQSAPSLCVSEPQWPIQQRS
jgi:hypothetical protein